MTAFAIPLSIRCTFIPNIRKGLGRKLLVALIAEARRLNKHVMVAGIESQNHASLHLHETLGFITTGQMPQVGTKFGRWLDRPLCSCSWMRVRTRTAKHERVAHSPA